MIWFITGLSVLLCASVVLWVMGKRKQNPRKDVRRSLDLAMVGLAEHLRRNPHDFIAHTKVGIIKSRKGDLRGAVADLTRAIEISPTHTEARYHRALIYVQDDHAAEAKKELEWIIQNSEDPYYKTASRDKLKLLKAGKKVA